MGVDPHPLVFLERTEELSENLILYELKFLKVFGFVSSSPIFSWKMSKPKQKKYLIIFGIRQPPLFLKNFQTQAKQFLNSFGIT